MACLSSLNLSTKQRNFFTKKTILINKHKGAKTDESKKSSEFLFRVSSGIALGLHRKNTKKIVLLK
jgi:hypothetical protein